MRKEHLEILVAVVVQHHNSRKNPIKEKLRHTTSGTKNKGKENIREKTGK